jgi:hypothetical protein
VFSLLESLRTTLDTINQSSFSTIINVPVNYAIRPSGPTAGLHSLRLRRELILTIFIDPGVGHSMPDGTAHSTKILESSRPVYASGGGWWGQCHLWHRANIGSVARHVGVLLRDASGDSSLFPSKGNCCISTTTSWPARDTGCVHVRRPLQQHLHHLLVACARRRLQRKNSSSGGAQDLCPSSLLILPEDLLSSL